MLLWTISDFPAYGNLAGCTIKGKMACPLCGKNTDSMWLKFSRKHVYMCHRKGLPPSHSYRGKKAWFDGKEEHGRKGRILTGQEISQNLKNFKNDFGNFKQSATKRKKPDNARGSSDSEESGSEEEEDEEVQVDKEELSRWKKRSIFLKLPYWEKLPVRHNIDVMHVERNVAASIVSTLLHCGKSKDGIQARKDLENLGIRKDLHPCTQEKKVFCRQLFDFKGRDGYCSDISRGISLDDCKVTGLKSHDYHVLMQQLLPIALRGMLPKGPRVALIPLDSDDHGETLKWLAYGPRSSARSYTCYIVNGQRFHTRSVDRKSQNSGVFYEATAVFWSILEHMGHKEHGGTWHMEAAQLDTQRKKGEAILKTSSTVHSTNRSSSSTRPAKLQLDRAGESKSNPKNVASPLTFL
ncbi:unnamed protein product [Microthlaspi erraticum]|uniref:Uncharacterized protein n=1 Tax=Microthlaspi erraticum TaxID=1685480 RepID=A0A6D2HW45_9BRAS|nr:unnamed protein product [Microthlaspi erraticum]